MYSVGKPLAVRGRMPHGGSIVKDKYYNVITVECPRCKVEQKVHVAARPGAPRSEEWVSCINCDHHFKVTIPDRIVDRPFRS
jgi:transcription elongation factor Elf1